MKAIRVFEKATDFESLKLEPVDQIRPQAMDGHCIIEIEVQVSIRAM